MRKSFVKFFVFAVVSLLSVTTLFSCGNGEENPTHIYSIVTPAGSPAFSQLYVENQKDKYEVEKTSGPQALQTHFNAGEKDVILAPSNVGLQFYNRAKKEGKNFHYELAANIVFGNIYIVSKEKLTIKDLEGKNIVSFGENASPGLTLKYVLEKNNVTLGADTVWLNGGADVIKKFATDTNQICLVPEPAISALETRLNVTFNRISILEEYKKITSNDFPQASLYIKKSLTKEEKNSIITDFKNSNEKVNNDHSAAADLAITLGYEQPKPVIVKALPSMNIKFASGQDCKNTTLSYFGELIKLNKNFVGGVLPEDDFFFLG